ncbi:MAG: lantibiotic immunity ABC transporter MutG family permease subunit [Clostridiales bacterium]|nr:lantibiotic immunity ABC transporter MutG family permease subunit [Clostridiales bacterium]
MIEFKKLIKADIIKFKSTQILWMHLYIPILGLIIFLSYYSYTPWTNFGKVSAYLQVLCIVFPVLIGIITSIVAEQEFAAGGFQNILIASETKYLSIISKFTLCLLFGSLGTILAVAGFYIAYSFIASNIYPIYINIAIMAILMGSNLFLYILHFFLSFRFSKAVSIGVGIAESLVAALFLTGMGDGRWPFAPSSWSIRFIGLLLMKYQNIESVSIDQDLKLGVVISTFLTFFSFIIMLAWFKNWEGNRSEE